MCGCPAIFLLRHEILNLEQLQSLIIGMSIVIYNATNCRVCDLLRYLKSIEFSLKIDNLPGQNRKVLPQ